MKKILITLIFASKLLADSIDLIEFESDLFSRNSDFLKKISITLHLRGKNLELNSYSIQDGLNIVLSSYYIEDLLTSKGKEEFKKAYKKYLKERYKVIINDIYILKLVQINQLPDIDLLIDALKKNGCCKGENIEIKKQFEKIKETK